MKTWNSGCAAGACQRAGLCVCCDWPASSHKRAPEGVCVIHSLTAASSWLCVLRYTKLMVAVLIRSRWCRLSLIKAPKIKTFTLRYTLVAFLMHRSIHLLLLHPLLGEWRGWSLSQLPSGKRCLTWYTFYLSSVFSVVAGFGPFPVIVKYFQTQNVFELQTHRIWSPSIGPQKGHWAGSRRGDGALLRCLWARYQTPIIRSYWHPTS